MLTTLLRWQQLQRDLYRVMRLTAGISTRLLDRALISDELMQWHYRIVGNGLPGAWIENS
jgi:hypothetical protein